MDELKSYIVTPVTPETKVFRDGTDTVVRVEDANGKLYESVLGAFQTVPILGEAKAD